MTTLLTKIKKSSRIIHKLIHSVVHPSLLSFKKIIPRSLRTFLINLINRLRLGLAFKQTPINMKLDPKKVLLYFPIQVALVRFLQVTVFGLG
jgi:hypothetical protein